MPIQSESMKLIAAAGSSTQYTARNIKDSSVAKSDSFIDGEYQPDVNLNNKQLLSIVSHKTHCSNSNVSILDTHAHNLNQENIHLNEAQSLDKPFSCDTEYCAEKDNNECNMQYSISIMCQRNDECESGIQDRDLHSNLLFSKHALKTTSELILMSVEELNFKVHDLIQSVEDMSSELVSLLLENDALQQESDARNVSIEQLLKLTWKHTENELRTVQMSVILPTSDSETHTD